MSEKKKKAEERYAPIPTRFIVDTRLTAMDHRVLGAIAAHDQFGRNGVGCWASHKTLAKKVKANVTSVTKSIRRLVDFGYIHASKRKNDARFRVYRVVYTPEDEAVFCCNETLTALAKNPKSVAAEKEIDGLPQRASRGNHSISHTPIYSPKGEKYKEIDPPKGDLGIGNEHDADEVVLDKAYLIKKDAELGKTDLAVGTERLIANLASGKDARRSTLMSESDQVIDDASKRAKGHQPGKIFEREGRDPKPSSALLGSALSRKARGL